MSQWSGGAVAVIVAAGKSQRLGQDKLLIPLEGVPLLAWTVEVFEASPLVDRVVLVVNETNRAAVESLRQRRGWTKADWLVLGGPNRQDSVRNGLAETDGCQWVLIHDGARPFVDEDIIRAGLTAVEATGAAIAAVPVKDTIKVVDANRRIVETPVRDALWAAQTPQVFRRSLIWEAYQRVSGPVTDDASLLEQLGHTVVVFPGSYENLKVTTPEDVELARLIAARRAQSARRPRL